MKILIIRCFPQYMEVKNASYNIQEIGLARALVKKGHQCDIVFWTDKEEKEVQVDVDGKNSITVFYRQSKVFLKNAFFDIDDLIKKYDIIEPSEYNQLAAWKLSKKYPDKTVIYHGPYYCEFNKRYNAMCKVFDKIVLPAYKKNGTTFLVKSDLANDFLTSKGIKSENVTTVGVGIDLDAFKQSNTNEIPDEIKEIQNIKADIKLLYIGRIEERRNIPFLFDILNELKNRNVNAKLVMIGNGDEEYCKNCFDYAKKCCVFDSIYHIKKAEQKYLQYAYKSTDIFLLPTRYEIFGMVLLEAMYFGTPAITTKNGGSQMLIENGIDGYIIDVFNKSLWCDKIIEASQNSAKISQNAHKKITEKFTWDVLSDKFISTYEKKINNENSTC